jgi:choline dehydrogenase
VFLRGSPHDYDRWAQAGARGWSYDDVLPAFQRMESWKGEEGNSRGRSGPVSVSEPARLSEGARAFIAACEALGFARNRDVNDGPIDGVCAIQMNVRRGRRHSTAQAYLRPARTRANLQVLTGVTVRRIVIEGGRAVGVVAHIGGAEQIVTAAREVLVCSGAIGSPHLLMHSGIGDGAALQAFGLPVTVHAPGVGQNLQDHFITRFSYRTRPAGTMNELTATKLSTAKMALGYALRRDGPMAVGATEATLFARVTPGAEEADVQFQFINFSLAETGYVLARYPGIMFNFNQCRPDSRGSLTLRSADPADKPIIHANYLSDPRDQFVILEAAKLAQRLGRTRPFRDLVEEELTPAPDVEDEAGLLDHIRRTGTTVYHPCGTCRMGSDERAVVDPQLRVRGVNGLRVVDASVIPLVPSSNIQPSVMMIAERAAEFIKT